MTTPKNSTMTLLASAFHAMHGSVNAEDWRYPVARCFGNISDALIAGMPPEEVAIVCRAAAVAIMRPEEFEQAFNEAKAELTENHEQS
jgi:glyoxylate carboligase